MIIQTAFQDVQLVDTLENLVKTAAEKLNLPVSALMFDDIKKTDEHLYVRYENQGVELYVDLEYVNSRPEKILKSDIAYNICCCKDMQEGLYDERVFCPFPDDRLQSRLAMEMDKAYTSHMASRRYINTFGKKSFKEWHIYGLADFYTELDGAILEFEGIKDGLREIAENQYLLIFALFKEYIKSNAINLIVPGSKKPLHQLAMKLGSCFETIDSVGVSWIDKTKLVYITGVMMNLEYSMIESYLKNELIPRTDENRRQGLSQLLEQLDFTKDCRETLYKIENELS